MICVHRRFSSTMTTPDISIKSIHSLHPHQLCGCIDIIPAIYFATVYSRTIRFSIPSRASTITSIAGRSHNGFISRSFFVYNNSPRSSRCPIPQWPHRSHRRRRPTYGSSIPRHHVRRGCLRHIFLSLEEEQCSQERSFGFRA